MMSLVLDNGEEVTIVTDGNDEEAAMESIVAFLTGKEEQKIFNGSVKACFAFT